MEFKPGDVVALKAYPGSLARVVHVFDRRPGFPQSHAEIEFIQGNPFQAKSHRVYLTDLKAPPAGFVAAVDLPPPGKA